MLAGNYRGAADANVASFLFLWILACRQTRESHLLKLHVQVNLVLDPLLIFGLGWGVGGAAVATAAAEYSAAALYLACLWRQRQQLGAHQIDFPTVEWFHGLQRFRNLTCRPAERGTTIVRP